MDFDVNRFIEVINLGRFPGLLGEYTTSDDVALIPGEQISWIGEVSTDVPIFGPRVGGKYGAVGALLGISHYRIALLLEYGIIKTNHSLRSFWFEVDFGEEVWERGKLSKKTFIDLRMKPPRLKKGLMSREIVIKNVATLESGKTKETFEGVLSSIKWASPEQGKFVGGKSDLVQDALLEAFKDRVPVSLGDLLLLLADPEMLEESAAVPEMAEGRALRTEEEIALAAEEIEQAPEEAIAPVKKAPAKKAPAKKASAKKAPTKKAPAKKTLAKKAPAKKAPAKKASAKKVPTKKAPTKKAPAKKTLAKKAPAKKAPAKKASAKKVPTKKAPAKKAARGVAVKLVCTECGNKLRPETLFCGRCGTKVAPQGETPGKGTGAEAVSKSHVDDITCPSCKANLEAEWVMCPLCGETLPSK